MGIILLSGYEENLQLHYAARTLTEISGRGGIGYLVKDRTSRDILFNALQRVNHGWLAVDTLFAIEAAERYRSQESARAKFNEREVEILDLLTQGYTNDQIADLIHHSKAVVERDLSSIFAKLGISGEGHSFRGENRRVLAVLEWLRRKGRLN